MFSAVGLKGTSSTPTGSSSRSGPASGSSAPIKNRWSQVSSTQRHRLSLIALKSSTRPTGSSTEAAIVKCTR